MDYHPVFAGRCGLVNLDRRGSFSGARPRWLDFTEQFAQSAEFRSPQNFLREKSLPPGA